MKTPYEIEICTPAKELHVTMSLDKYAHLLNVKSGDETGTNVNTSLGSSSRSQKMSFKMK